MKRLAIFSVYDKDGVINKYVDYYLLALKEVAENIVVVANGSVNEECVNRLNMITTKLYIRKNTGYDAGAYKDCIVNYIGIEKIREYDELILINDTCYGPLKPFEDIFNNMSETLGDFWGIKKMNLGFLTYIQSWFLVFKKNILQDDRFYKYWVDYIKDESCDIKDAYSRFEIGIYRYLTKCGYNSDVYVHGDNQVNVYKSSYYDLKSGIPFLKRKVFSDDVYTDSNAYYTLEYIREKSNYPLELILDDVKKKYNRIIDLEKLKYKCIRPDKCIVCSTIEWSERMFLNILNKFKKLYIYGAGIWAYNIYVYLQSINRNIEAFIVSDSKTVKDIDGIAVIKWNEIKLDTDCGIIVAMKIENSKQIYKKYKENMQFIWLWKDITQ